MTLAIRWSQTEARAVDAALRRLLRGFRVDMTDPHVVDDYMSILVGHQHDWVLQAIEDLRGESGRFKPPTPGDVLGAVRAPRLVASSRRQDCPACFHATCRCGAVDPPPEAQEALERLFGKDWSIR